MVTGTGGFTGDDGERGGDGDGRDGDDEFQREFPARLRDGRHCAGSIRSCPERKLPLPEELWSAAVELARKLTLRRAPFRSHSTRASERSIQEGELRRRLCV